MIKKTKYKRRTISLTPETDKTLAQIALVKGLTVSGLIKSITQAMERAQSNKTRRLK